MNVWTVHANGETAYGTAVPVIWDGEVVAVVSPIWSDEDGVRVSVDWQREIFGGISALGDLSVGDAEALAEVLRQVAASPPPR